MNGKERALASLFFEKVDRVPITGGAVENAKWLEMASGIKMKYGFTMHRWENPIRAVLKAYKNVGADLLRGPPLLPKPPERATDGSLRLFGKNGAKEISSRYKTPEDVLEYVGRLPSISELRADFDFQNTYDTYLRNVKEAQEECGDTMLWSERSAGRSCGFMWYSTFGYRPYLTACVRYKSEMKRLFEYSAEAAYLNNEAVAGAIVENDLPPFSHLGEDICYDCGPMVSPTLLDEIYFPYLDRSLEPFRRAGVKIIWHSDGNIMPIVDRLIKAGVDGFQGFQEEYGPRLELIANMKTKSGKKPIIWGSVSVTTTLPFGTVEDVKRGVKRCIDIAAGGGGFVLAPSSTVGPEVPPENIFAFYKYGKIYGRMG